MASVFSSNTLIGLIDKHTDKIDVQDKINIILTPSFYWVKRAYLEVKFASIALKYAPSIFEGMLPEGNYAYYVVKTKEDYVFFAYEPDEIISFLESKGVESTQVSGVYFAQNEMEELSSPVECNEEDVLVMHKGTLIQLNKHLVDTSSLSAYDNKEQELSKHKVTLHKSSVTHSFKELVPLFSVLSLLIVLYATQLFFTYSQQQALNAQSSVFSHYKLPPTFLQNSSIEKKLSKDFKAQRSFRQLMSSLLKFPMSQRQGIKSLNYDKGLFKIIFQMSETTQLKELKSHLIKSVGTLADVSIEKNSMRIKIK